MLVPFTEKPYEKYIAAELGRKTNLSFSPDQPLEGTLGFDDGFFLPWPFIAPLTSLTSKKTRQQWAGILLDELEHISEELGKRLPPFRLNLFLQYKRPEYMSRASAAEWGSWNCCYYRYATLPHQQALLEKIDAHAAGRALTLYASAAFCTSDDLFRFAEAGTVLGNSNLATVSQLTGHERYTYASSGTSGIACSEPTPIEGDGLTPLERMDDLEGLSLTEHIIGAGKLVNTVVEAGPDSARQLYRRALAARQYPEGTRTGPYLQALRSIAAFSDAFNVTYLAIG